MLLETIQYSSNRQWSSTLPDLDSPNTLILVFFAPVFHDNQKPLNDLFTKYPTSKIIGCSTAGEIFDSTVFDDTISIAILKFEKTEIKIASATLDASANGSGSYKAGINISEQLNADGLKSILVFSDGLAINGSELSKGLNATSSGHIVISGGLAGDGANFKKTCIIENGHIKSKTVVAVGFYGEHIRIGHGSKGGWDIFGPERLITKSSGNILYELDHKPALDLYKEYLGEKSTQLPASGLLFPLSIRSNLTDEKHLVRTILAVNEQEKSLTFAGDVPEGHLAQLMRANFDRLIMGALTASKQTHASMLSAPTESTPILLLAVSCVGRKLILGERISEETESTLDQFTKATKQIGFYSYGELSPCTEGKCELHNQTMTLTSITEVV